MDMVSRRRICRTLFVTEEGPHPRVQSYMSDAGIDSAQSHKSFLTAAVIASAFASWVKWVTNRPLRSSR